MKMILLVLSCLLQGCTTYYSFPISMVREQVEFNNLEGKEKCDRAHIDLRKACRDKLSKEAQETKQMSESMKKKHW